MIHFTATHPKCKKRRFSQIIRLGHNWLEKRCTNWVLESIIHVEVSHGSLFVDFEALWLLKAHVVYAKSRSLQKNWNEEDSGPSSQRTTNVISLSFFLWKSKSRAHVGQLMQRLHLVRRWVTKWEDMMALHMRTKFLLQSCRIPSEVNIFLGAP